MRQSKRPSEMPDAVVDPIAETVQEHDDYMFNLDCAYRHAQQALDALYRTQGPKRSFWHRMALGRAQSILISMYVKEMKRKDPRN